MWHRGLFVWLVAMGCFAEQATADEFRVYFGTYTGPHSRGIYQARFDAETGRLEAVELAGEAVNPSFLAVHPNRKFLYAVGEIGNFEGQKTGGVSAFAIDSASGKLTLLNQQSSQGAGPCHIVVDRAGTSVLVANYGGGSVASLPLAADGRLQPAASAIQHEGRSVNPRRQEQPHAHSINLDPLNRFAFAADLGLDKILIYRFDSATSRLTPHSAAGVVAAGSGPRHFAFHPSGRFAYVINELANTVTAFAFDGEAGTLTELQTITTLPADFQGTSYTAEVVVHPTGRYLYGSNRGHNSLAIFRIEEATGRLTPLGHVSTGGKTPRNFQVDPTGRWILAANQGTNTVVVLKIDLASGAVTPTGQSVAVPTPVCIRFVPLD
uniref:Lactonase family protein n=1 Tax=Schlesneria paludicola TaxID=360056 RepID=A0A7C4LQC9_9PLAN